MALKTTKWDASRFLDRPEVIVEYVNAAIDDGNTDVLLKALQNVCKAQGMTVIAERTGLGRESLYKALSPGSKPQFETISKVIAALGVKLRVDPVAGEKAA